MAKGVIGRVVLGIWLGCLTVTAAQLPPEIMMDRYLLRAERLMEAKDPKGALELMGKIVALQKEHGLTFPEEFHFKHATVALSAGAMQEAIDAVSTYLVEAGREGKFYREALELLEEAERLQAKTEKIRATVVKYLATMDRMMEEKNYEAALEAMHMILYLHREHDFALPDGFQSKYAQVSRFTQDSCTGKEVEAKCWKALTNQSECHVWNPYVVSQNETVTWSAECSRGLAQGTGTLVWNWSWNWILDGRSLTHESTGHLLEGKKHGKWIERYPDEVVGEGAYAEGKRQGPWVFRAKDGTVTEGAYMVGKQHGPWVERFSGSGTVAEHLRGERDGGIRVGHQPSISEGLYVGGKRDGNWVVRYADGEVWEGPYVDGERHGEWVVRYANGVVREGPYVDGYQHGQWVSRYADGSVEYANFENDERVGETSGSPSQARSAVEDFNTCVNVSNCAREGTRVCIENHCSQPAFVRFCTQDLGGRYTPALCGSVSVRANDGFIHQGSVDHAAETYWRACPWDNAKGTKEQACYFELPR